MLTLPVWMLWLPQAVASTERVANLIQVTGEFPCMHLMRGQSESQSTRLHVESNPSSSASQTARGPDCWSFDIGSLLYRIALRCPSAAVRWGTLLVRAWPRVR